MMDKILIIDDDLDFIQMLTIRFRLDGYEVFSAISGGEGIRMAYECHPDVILLDIMMPEKDGFDTCHNLRRMTSTPILFLTARSAESDVIRGLYQGADDYLSKPFRHEILDARIRALLRRARTPHPKPVKVKQYSDDVMSIDLDSQYIMSSGKKQKLTPTERDILGILLNSTDKSATYQELAMKFWGRYDHRAKESLAVHITSLRKKMRMICDVLHDHEYIQNQRGVGYLFVPRKSSQP
jgi:two-component system response regulator VicR